MSVTKKKSVAGTLLAVVFIVFPILYWKELPDPTFSLRVIVLSLAGLVLTPGIQKDWGVLSRPSRNSPFGLFPVSVLVLLIYTLSTCFYVGNPCDAIVFWLFIAANGAFALIFAAVWKNCESVKQRISDYAAFSAFLYIILFALKFMPEFYHALQRNEWPVIRYADGGTAGNKNFLSESLTLNLFFILPALAGKSGKRYYWSLLALVVSVVFILLLNSFAAQLAVISGLTYYFSTSIGGDKRRKLKVKVIMLMVLSASLLLVSTNDSVKRKVDRFEKTISTPLDITVADISNNNSVYERLLMWRNSLHLIRDHPLFGVGLNNWKIEQAKYGIGGNPFLNSGMERFEHPHNEFLSIASELGFIGLAIVILAFFIAFKTAPADPTSTSAAYTSASRSALIALFILCLFAYPLHREVTLALAALHLAILTANQRAGTTASQVWKPAGHVAFVVFLGTTIVFLFRINAEYHLGQGTAAQLKRSASRANTEYAAAASVVFPLDANGTPVEWYSGNELFRSGNTITAIKRLEEGRKRNPYHVRLLNDLGTVYEQSGHHDSAISCYLAALRYCPSLTETRLNLAAAYYNSFDLDSAYIALVNIKAPEKLKGRDKLQFKLFTKVVLNEFVTSDSALKSNNAFKQAFTDSLEWEAVVLACFQSNAKPSDFLRCIKVVPDSVFDHPVADKMHRGRVE